MTYKHSVRVKTLYDYFFKKWSLGSPDCIKVRENQHCLKPVDDI